VYKQDAPDWHLTPEAKHALGDDTNRGFLRILPNKDAGGALNMWGTIAVFEMPDIAEGKDCRFHFFLGSGDAAGGFSRLQLYSLANVPEVEEFGTTYNNRPSRQQYLGTFAVYPPKWLTDTNPVPDVVANVPDNHNDPAVAEEWTGDVPQQIVLKCPVRKAAYDIVPHATEASGIMSTLAWSLNKGLSIEILGVSKEQVPLWNPHDDDPQN